MLKNISIPPNKIDNNTSPRIIYNKLDVELIDCSVESLVY